ncbi:MAG: guanylate kinase [Clostridia bacterium]|nr:guanylate kinase [Clostridia bacterium]
MNNQNVLVVLSGPSGVGKGTLAKLIVEKEKDIALSISCATRNPRVGEVNGREYFFISKEEFKKKIENGGFLEYSEHFENYYGTPKDFVLETLKSKNVLLEIDVNGGLEVKKNFEKALLIMILPPSIEEIRKRLIGRGTETEEKINLRMERIEYELGKKELYDYSVVNDNLDVCADEIIKIIKIERSKLNEQ